MSKRSGFTLVELSVSLVIIGLIIGGVLGGTMLLKQAKLRVVIKELTENRAAITGFKDKFKYYPGDYPVAAKYWSGTTNGNGDWQISGNTTESLRAWQHLKLSDYISGQYTGATGTPTYIPGQNVPKSNYKDTYVYFIRFISSSFGKSGNGLTLAAMKSDGSAAWDGASLETPDAKSIDEKIDDGNAGTGNLFALNGSIPTDPIGTDNQLCSGTDASAPTNYNLATTGAACRLTYWLDQQ